MIIYLGGRMFLDFHEYWYYPLKAYRCFITCLIQQKYFLRASSNILYFGILIHCSWTITISPIILYQDKTVLLCRTFYILQEYFFSAKVSQKFCNILITYLLYCLDCNKMSLIFKVEAIILHNPKPPFCQSFDPMQIPVLVLRGKEHLHGSFHLFLVVEDSSTGSESWSEQVIIWRS